MRPRHMRREPQAARRLGMLHGGGFLLAGVLLLATPLVGQGTGGATPAAVIPIRGEINDVLWNSIQRRIDGARADGVGTIIFEMDTPGGLVTSALEICRAIKNLPPEIRTVAWVNPQAYSAGAMISLACDEILMSRSSSIGDCAPIMISPVGGAEEMSERLAAKAESPILQEFRDSAQKNGYNLLLARAMVKWEQEIWWVQNADTGERKFVGGEEKKQLIDDLEEGTERTWSLVTSFIDPISNTEHALEQPIDADDSLLTLSQGEAVAFGFAKAIVGDLSDVQTYLKLSTLPAYFDISGWEKFATWLNSPLVRGIIFVIMLIGAYIEFQSPGLILPGVTAAIALAIFLGAPYAAGLADIWTVILLVLGLLLVAIEVFVLPGFGVAGVAGLLLIAISLLGTFVPPEPGEPSFALPELQYTWDAIKTGLVVLASSTVIAVIGIGLMAKYLPHTPFARRLVLANPNRAEIVTVGDANPDTAFVGDIGVVTGDLRPGGQARFGQDIVEVHSQGEYLEAGTRVQVIKHDGMSVVVRPLPDETT